MTKKILFSIIFFYIFVLFESSFLVHFEIFNKIPSLILPIVILWNILEKSKEQTGIFFAFFAGFFWDIFSSNFIGFHILILMGLAVLIKFVLKKYLQPAVKLSFF